MKTLIQAKFNVVRLLLLFVILASSGVPLVRAQAPDTVPSIVPINETYAGKTYSNLTEAWCQWALCQSVDPMGDTTGEWASVGQKGDFWFLAGTHGDGEKVFRTVTIPSGKAIFFPIVNIWNDYNPKLLNKGDEIPPTLWDVLDLLTESVTDMECVIDGTPVENVYDYRAWSRGYPDSWGFNCISEGVRYPMVAEGYWILLKPLPVGKHTIDFKGNCITYVSELGLFFNVQIDVSYEITIQGEK